MGNNPSPSSPSQPLPYKISHQILQNSEISCSKNIMKTHIDNCNENELQRWISLVEQVPETDREYLLVPRSIQLKEISIFGGCGLTLIFDCFPYLLMDQIDNRRAISATFEEQEIWYLLWALVDSQMKLFSKGMKLGDIRPHNILFNQSGEIKLISSLSWPSQVPNYRKSLKKFATYLSPQQLDLLLTGQQTDTSHTESSQSFSIGLTLLSLMRVDSMLHLYQTDQMMYFGINFHKLQKYLVEIQTATFLDFGGAGTRTYTGGLVFVVRGLCEKRVGGRLRVSQLWTWLKPYEHNIINFQPFQLHKTLQGLLAQQQPPPRLPNRQSIPFQQILQNRPNQNRSPSKPESIYWPQPQINQSHNTSKKYQQYSENSQVQAYQYQAGYRNTLQLHPVPMEQNFNNGQGYSIINHSGRVANSLNQGQYGGDRPVTMIAYHSFPNTQAIQTLQRSGTTYTPNITLFQPKSPTQPLPIPSTPQQPIPQIIVLPSPSPSPSPQPQPQPSLSPSPTIVAQQKKIHNHILASEKKEQQSRELIPEARVTQSQSIRQQKNENRTIQKNEGTFIAKPAESLYLRQSHVRRFAEQAQRLISKIDSQLQKSKSMFPST